MDRETAYALRGQAARAAVRVSDGGVAQAVQAETHEGVIREGVEVMQPYGFGAVPPGGAGITLVLAVGGDQGDMVALPASAPGYRLGALGAGEVAVYDAGGNRVHLQSGGVIVILAATKVRIVAPQVEIVASSGVAITGNVTVAGNITATGDISDPSGSMAEMRARYNAHTHGAGPGPSPVMD